MDANATHHTPEVLSLTFLWTSQNPNSMPSERRAFAERAAGNLQIAALAIRQPSVPAFRRNAAGVVIAAPSKLEMLACQP